MIYLAISSLKRFYPTPTYRHYFSVKTVDCKCQILYINIRNIPNSDGNKVDIKCEMEGADDFDDEIDNLRLLRI